MSAPSENNVPATRIDALDHLSFTRDLVEVAYMAAGCLADMAEVGAFQTPLAIALDRIASLKTFLEASDGARS